MPDVEFPATRQTVVELFREQWEQLSGLSCWGGICPDVADVSLAGHGWDNWVFVVQTGSGVPVMARLPRRLFAVPLIHREAAVVDAVGPLLQCAFPDVLFVGEPSAAFDAPWLLCSWVSGEDADTIPAADRAGMAAELAATLASLHRAGDVALRNDMWRGGALQDAPAWDWGRSVDVLGQDAVDVLVRAVDAGLGAGRYGGQEVWLHCDVHPKNVVHNGGEFAGLIDFGDFTVGDPAYDLAAGWWMFDQAGRDVFRAEYAARHTGEVDDAAWVRAAAVAARVAGVAAVFDDTWVSRASRIASELTHDAPG